MLVECQLQMLKVWAPSLVFQFICFKRILNSQVLFVSVKASFVFVFSVTFQWMQCCPSATGKLLKNALQSFSLFFGIKVCFVWMLMFICPKLNCPQVLFLFVSLLYSSFFFFFSCSSHFFLPVLYLCWDDDSFSFSSFLPLLLVSHIIPACSFPKKI